MQNPFAQSSQDEDFIIRLLEGKSWLAFMREAWQIHFGEIQLEVFPSTVKKDDDVREG